MPENRVYRYNFFYDNCTTRARDVIERCIERKAEKVDMEAAGEAPANKGKKKVLRIEV